VASGKTGRGVRSIGGESPARTLGLPWRPGGSSSVGTASAIQAECREFEPRLPLQTAPSTLKQSDSLNQLAKDYYVERAGVGHGAYIPCAACHIH
jgi:hypothetical protein